MADSVCAWRRRSNPSRRIPVDDAALRGSRVWRSIFGVRRVGGSSSQGSQSAGKGESVLTVPRPGQLYWVFNGDGDRHPCIIVSREELNRGTYVVAVLLTSTNFETRRSLMNCVPIYAGQFGLTKNCVAQCETVSFVPKDEFDWSVGPIGSLDSATLRAVVRSIGFVLSAECEPV